jgi:hypothetical protein
MLGISSFHFSSSTISKTEKQNEANRKGGVCKDYGGVMPNNKPTYL